MITMKDLNELSIVQLQDTKVLIDTLVQNKMKRQFVIGTKVNVVQKTKKTPGVITKIMQSKCLFSFLYYIDFCTDCKLSFHFVLYKGVNKK